MGLRCDQGNVVSGHRQQDLVAGVRAVLVGQEYEGLVERVNGVLPAVGE